jgi:hypothetical protein
MALAREPCPDFSVHLVRPSGAPSVRASFRSLLRPGVPTVVDFYDSG